MNTDDLIARLAQETRPVRRTAVGRRLAFGIALGAACSAVLLMAWLGPRDDLRVAVDQASYWMKWAYTLSLAAAAVALTWQLARPDTGPIRGAWLVALPVGLLAMVGLAELSRTPRAGWSACPILVLIFAMPIFAGLIWAFRRLAPTRLRAAGAAAGLTAGAVAASVYCLHCPEASALFVLTWYSLGILLATMLGWLFGPRLLRW
jgi:hypothetical protein